MSAARSRDHGVCVDCGQPLIRTPSGSEYYMVHDELWAASGLGRRDGFLCVGCLEDRLGRRLGPDDFTDAPINWLPGNSERLHARMGARWKWEHARMEMQHRDRAGRLEVLWARDQALWARDHMEQLELPL